MNTIGLEWFGPPERNTLHPLCAVLLKTEELELSSVCVYVSSLFVCGERLTNGPNDVV